MKCKTKSLQIPQATGTNWGDIIGNIENQQDLIDYLKTLGNVRKIKLEKDVDYVVNEQVGMIRVFTERASNKTLVISFISTMYGADIKFTNEFKIPLIPVQYALAGTVSTFLTDVFRADLVEVSDTYIDISITEESYLCNLENVEHLELYIEEIING